MRNFWLLLSVLWLWTCSGGGGDGGSPTEPTEPTDPNYVINLTLLSGQAQKGPFNNGTSINVAELSNTLSPTGRNFSSAITDNSGRFSVSNVQLVSPFVELRATGFYFNEISNNISDAQLTLYALSDLTNKSSLNVNILTHLEKNRMQTLMSGDSPQTFAQAKIQAQEEVLAIFDYSRANMPDSELLDISQGGAANAKLLAISAILQGDQAVGQMSELLANISTDISTDGTLDATNLKDQLITNSQGLNFSEIRANLEARFTSLGITATIPDFETEINQFLKPPVANDMSISTDEDTAINITLDATDPEDETLTYTILEQNNATITLSGNVATYTPDTNFNGTDTFTYYANDGTSDSNIATVTVNVGAIDDEPNTIDVATSTDEDVSVVITLSAEEYDGDSFSFSIIDQPSNGTVSLNGSTATYTPNQDFNGEDTFTFEATDDTGRTINVATATITVNPVNDAPVANDITNQVTDENRMMQLDITLDATDVEGDALTYGVASTNNGSVTINNNIATYVPNQDWNGEDTFTYVANDGSLDSNAATVTITVNSVNDAPVTQNVSFTTDEDTPYTESYTAYVTDIDGDNLTLIAVTNPSNGTATCDNIECTYTPNQDFNGTDSFTYKANDGELDSNVSTVSVTISPVNDAPVAPEATKSTNEDTEIVIGFDLGGATGNSNHVQISDVDSDSGTVSIVSSPSNGTIGVGSPSNGGFIGNGAVSVGVSYTPDANWNGTDTFTYKFNDGELDSNTATVTITVNAVDDEPNTLDVATTTDEDNAVEISLSAEEYDGDSYSFAIITDVSNGTTSLNGSTVTYTPNQDFNGEDTFTFEATDDTGRTINVATATITVNPVNDAPVTTDGSASTNEDTAVDITLSSTDVEGDSVTYSVVSDVSNGSTSLSGSTVTYTPSANFNGTDTFTFKANDGTDDSNISTVTITINEAPTVTSFTLTTDEDVPANIVLQASDDSTTDLQYQFTQALKDWTGAFEGAGTTNSILSQDGNVLEVFSGGGTAVFDDSLVVFTPGKDQHTASWSAVYPDTLKYRAYDGMAYSEEAEIIINVNPINDAPISQGDISVSQGEDDNMGVNGFSMGIQYAFLDPDHRDDQSIIFKEINTSGGNLNFWINPPDNNSYSLTPAVGDTIKWLDYEIDENGIFGKLSFMADENFNGDAGTFTATGWDGELESDPRTWTITVTPTNDLPEADDQSVTTDEDTAVDITVSATDVDGDDLSYSISTAPSNGTASISGNIITYTPSSNFNGTDTIDFKASDGTLDQNPNSVAIGTITITVNAVNDAPTTEDVSTTIDENRTARIVGITLDGSDIEGDDLTYSVVSDASNGTTSISGSTLTYTANQDWNGTDTITYKANDGELDSNVSTVTIVVNSINDAPVATDVEVNTNEDEAISYDLSNSVTDVEADDLTYTIVSQPGDGTVSLDGSTITYTPNSNYNGSDTALWKVSDGTDESSSKAFTVIVASVNDTPTTEDVSVSTDEDTDVSIQLEASDVDEDTLTYSIVTDPSSGTVGVSGATAVYTPSANFNGTDTFTYKANDGTVDSNTSTVTITVASVNDAPVANDVSSTIDENRFARMATLTLDATDVEGDALTYSLVSDPSNGTASVSGSTLTYNANQDWNGTETFTYKANDGTADSNTATITITVNAINDTPVVVGTDEKNSKSIDFDRTSSGGGYHIYDSPSRDNGTVGNTLTTAMTLQVWAKPEQIHDNMYVVGKGNKRSAGTEAFGIGYRPDTETNKWTAEFKTDIGYLLTSSSDIMVNEWVHLVLTFEGNDIKFYVNGALEKTQSLTTSANTVANGGPNGELNQDFRIGGYAANNQDYNNFDGNIDAPALWNIALSSSQISNLYNSGNGLSATEVSPSNLIGYWNFEGNMNDLTSLGNDLYDSKCNGSSNCANYVSTVPGQYNTPVTASTNEDTAVDISLVGTDVDGDNLSYSIVTNPSNGAVSISGSTATYTPSSNYNGNDSFVYKANDGTVDSANRTVFIEIAAVNDVPVTSDQTASTDEDTAVDITLSSTDVEGDSVTYSIVSDVSNGSTSLSGSTVTYTPTANYNGTDTFTFKANDGTDDGNTSTVTITVAAVNDEPLANDISISMDMDDNIVFNIDVSDSDGDSLSKTTITQPSNGTLLPGVGLEYTYTPTVSWSGTDSFTFLVSDGSLDSNIATVTFNVDEYLRHFGHNNLPIYGIERSFQNTNYLIVHDDSNAPWLVEFDDDLNLVNSTQFAYDYFTKTGTGHASQYFDFEKIDSGYMVYFNDRLRFFDQNFNFEKDLTTDGLTYNIESLQNGQVLAATGAITKYDSSGNQVWQKSYTSINDIEWMLDVKELSDGNYFVVGSGNNLTDSNDKATSAFKIDTNGDVLWYNNDLGLYHLNNQVIEDNGYIFIFGAKNYNSHDLIRKIDLNGNSVGNYDVGPFNYISMKRSEMFLHSSGDLILCGMNSDDILIQRVDQNGNIIWSKIISNPVGTYADLEGVEASDGNLIIMVSNAGGGNGQSNGVFKVDYNDGTKLLP